MADGIARSGFDIDLREGVERERAFARVLGKCTVEHKRDYLCQKTGNLFIEYEQKGKPSGIRVTTADYWAFEYAEDCWLVIPTKRLKALVKLAYRDPAKRKSGGDYDNYKGVLLPIDWLVRPWRALCDEAAVR